MRLWQRLAEALKDKNSVWAAQLYRRTSFRNLDLEVTAIKATSYRSISHRLQERSTRLPMGSHLSSLPQNPNLGSRHANAKDSSTSRRVPSVDAGIGPHEAQQLLLTKPPLFHPP
ncbi:hypothetical protein K1719_037558 [Acacia pycnantha]|nr:hypothetical protein K1719_037558 [Acacia pycnantha]